MSDPSPAEILATLQEHFAADATHDAALLAQIASLQAQVAGLSVPKPFLTIALTESPAHAVVTFASGATAEADFPPSGVLVFTANLQVVNDGGPALLLNGDPLTLNADPLTLGA